jgi:hypothetical protein
MKNKATILLLLVCNLLFFTNNSFASYKSTKPRIIITADPELDDNNSLIRFLLYSSDFNVEGLIYTSSQFHWKGDGKGTKFMVPGREYTKYGLNLCPCTSYRWREDERFIHDAVEAYEKVYSNLKIHDPAYPTPAYLKSKVKYGNIEFEGDYSKDTEGSNLIKSILLDNIAGPVYVTAWGGQSTIARALKSIEDQYSGTANWTMIKKKVTEKLVILPSGEQDNTYATYIKPNWPGIGYRQYKSGPNYGYGAQLVANKENAPLLTSEWMKNNITSKGPLGSIYRVWGDGKQMVKNDPFDYFGLDGYSNEELKKMGYIVWMPKQEKGSWLGEGDTGTFMNFLNNGLGADEKETPGGWGGKPFVPDPATYIDPFSNDTTKVKALVISEEFLKKQAELKANEIPYPNFFPAAQFDFVTRMNWSMTNNYQKANHAPVVQVKGEKKIIAKAGDVLTLQALVNEPDGDAYTINWWQFMNDKNTPQLTFQSSTTLSTKIEIPATAHTNQSLYVVVEVTDKKEIPLTRYHLVQIQL